MWAGLNGRPADLGEARRLADAARHRAPRGTRESHLRSAVALKLVGGDRTRPDPSPLLSHDRSVLLVADARIDNRVDIGTRLGTADLASRRDDAALLLEAYRQWGEGFADDLVGDFAIALWDEGRQRLIAARSLFALRPLVYRTESDRVIVASEAQQILAARGVSRQVFEPMLGAMLVRSPGLPRWSYYRDVSRLPPGHTLIVDHAGERVRAHAEFRLEEPWASDAVQTAERLRASLRDAVLPRLQASDAPGLLLSGGLDSTAVAGTAGVLAREGLWEGGLRTYGFSYTELRDCDELSVSSRVAAHYGFSSTPVPADTAWPLAEHPAHGPDLNGPDRLRSHVLFDRTLEIASSDGVTSMMTGHRGDSMGGGQVIDYLGALWDTGPLAFWRDLGAHSRRVCTSRGTLLARHVLRRVPTAIWPRGAASANRQAALQLMRKAEGSIPPWIRSDALTRLGLSDIIGLEVPRSTLKGEARRRRHDHILDPNETRNAEAVERWIARFGIRCDDPWADRRIAELMLSIPQHMITPAGEPKRLLREAMRGVLPEDVRTLARKQPPESLYVRGMADRSRETIANLIRHSRAAELGIVDEAVLGATYATYVAQPKRVREREWRWLWRFIDVEDWLRRYHSSSA